MAGRSLRERNSHLCRSGTGRGWDDTLAAGATKLEGAEGARPRLHNAERRSARC